MLQAEDPLPGEVPEGAGSEGRRLAEFDAAVAEIVARVEPAYRQADGWLEQTRAGLLELLRYCDEQPDRARELVVESIAWGPEVLQRRGQVLDALAQALERGGAQTAAEETASPALAENLVGACISLVHTRLLQQERGPFVELAPSLMGMIAHPYLGTRTARRELERSSTYAVASAFAGDSSGVAVGIRGRSS